MGARPGDYVVLLGPPAAVGSAVGVVLLAGEPEAFLPMLLVLQPLTTLGLVVGLVQLTRSNRGPQGGPVGFLARGAPPPPPPPGPRRAPGPPGGAQPPGGRVAPPVHLIAGGGPATPRGIAKRRVGPASHLIAARRTGSARPPGA